MVIAVTYENEQVYQHFGHTKVFKLYEVQDGKIQSSSLLSVEGSGHSALALLLQQKGVDTLICGGIGGGARQALAVANIQLFPGARGNADEQVQAYLRDALQYDPDFTCAHHDHAHGGECGEHTCGDHDACGSHA